MIVDIIFIAAVIGLLIGIYKIKFSKENIEREISQATKKAKAKDTQEKIKQQQEQILKVEQSNLIVPNNESEGWHNQSSEEDSEGEDDMDRKKQFRKEQKQKQKQQRKQAQEQYLQQLKQKREKYEKQSQQRERLEEQRRKKQQEIIEQLREDERKRKEQQFNKWKNMFSVEEVGKEKLSEQQQKKKQQTFNKQLIGALKTAKLSLLEDLSHKFKISVKELVDKIKQLQKQKLISGIFDERGKYLVIEQAQWNAIKNYISARGRVKKTDIMAQCAKIIKIPENIENDLLQLISQSQEKEASSQ